MHPNRSEEKALISLLTGMYEDIRAVEAEHGIYVSDKDLRPRIEYFHDAVRIYATGAAEAYQQGGRLSLEYLNYDIAYLRHIHDFPLSSGAKNSPAGKTLNRNQLALLKHSLVEQYKSYAVIYAAVFAPLADRDFKDRVEDLDSDVERLADLQQLIEQLGQGKAQAQSAFNAVKEYGDALLFDLVKKAIQQKSVDRENAIKAAIHRVKMMMKQKDKQIAGLDETHLNFLAGQMYVYEDAKTTVKKLMSQGLNVAGKFVESSSQQVQRTQTRGR